MFYSVIVLICLSFSFTEAQNRVKYCYVCRSRGPLGDCADPFYLNQTTVKDYKGVEATPCPSGWCGKAIEGKEGDPIIATERMCLQRPPTDQEERCAETLYQNKREPLFMCFCRGHLCNHGTLSVNANVNSLSIVLLVSFLYQFLSS
ncbi:uncharacterized protein LOC128394740 [Panonychus citri]|uniref:uncharacterized protein LOC128394740 n=1 Tax=Panonychus citri TaxID=50023 RepID=UPI0023076A91|nr:uncharacterized protein LOC128394740 [Panonychus citri]XP_053211073.1 uncharacterized protein LOC128394740 [Panonychus citri]